MTSRIFRYAADEDDLMGDTLTIWGWDIEHSLKCMNYFQHTAMEVYHTIMDGSLNLKPSDCIRGLADYIQKDCQSMFAKSLGMSHQYVSRILKGK
jgi:hypothetical protein